MPRAVFPPECYAFQKVSGTVDASATSAVRSFLSGTELIIQSWQYTPPVYVAPAWVPRRGVSRSVSPDWTRFTDMMSRVRVPYGAAPSAGTDSELTIVELDWMGRPERVVDLWDARLTGGSSLSASWGGVADVSSGVHEPGFGSAASGLAFLPTLVTAAEIREQRIDHALGLVLPVSLVAPGFVAPANRSDGDSVIGVVKYGQRLRVNPSFDVSTIPDPVVRAVTVAAQTYGCIAYDRGSFSIRAQNTGKPIGDGILHGFPVGELEVMTNA